MDKRTQCTLLLARSAALGIIAAAAIFVTRENSDRQIARSKTKGKISLDAESSGRRDIAAHSLAADT